jgi:hypothetical protein
MPAILDRQYERVMNNPNIECIKAKPTTLIFAGVHAMFAKPSGDPGTGFGRFLNMNSGHERLRLE